MLRQFKLVLAVFCVLSISSVNAEDSIKRPKTLEEIKELPMNDSEEIGDGNKLEIRKDALKEIALSYGALCGLVYRNWEIYNIAERQETVLDVIFDFSQLLIPTHYGALIEPPIISESDNAFLLDDSGMAASMTSKIYAIGENSKIVTLPRNWRDYLINNMDLEDPEEPDLILRPKTDEEMDIWLEYLEKGWVAGVAQSEDIFESHLNLLVADYIGMIRYRKLLAQNMISSPYAVKENRGITGNGDEMRIDDKAVIITSIPSLNTSSDNWEPTER